MDKKAKIIIAIIIVTVLIIGLNFYVGLNTVYFGNNTRVFVLGKKIIKTYRNNKILLKKVNYYKGGKEFDGYLKSNKDDTGYAYYVVSKYNKTVNTNDLVASGKMIKLNIVSPTEVDESLDESKLKSLNELLDLKLEYDNVIDYKCITFDIDNDSSEENVIFVNYRVDNIRTTKIFVKDDELISDVLEFEYDYTDMVNASNAVYYLTDLIDINKDSKYEIIVARIDGDSQPTYYDIFSYENGNIKEIE